MTEFKVPELGENVATGDVTKVLVNIGDTIKQEQPVLELETDKATIEVPSSVAGVVKEIRVKRGDKVKVGAVILTVDSPSSNGGGGAAQQAAAAPKPPEQEPAEHEPAEQKSAEPAPSQAQAAPQAAPSQTKVVSMPMRATEPAAAAATPSPLAAVCGQPQTAWSFSGRASVTNIYMWLGDTGLTPALTAPPSHIRGRTMSAGRGSTARQTTWPMYCGGLTSGNSSARVFECTPSAATTRS